MSTLELIGRVLLALFFPPLGILGLRDVGCCALLLVFLLTVFFWVPGQIVAIIMIAGDYGRPRHQAAS